ncbi:DUF4169 family protein [Methylobrevis albus]|uniref:DUF4169 family protein n=1 Tax=Methylobrevis albus TaxID=2793297 RepID=A0A931HZS5_9HYPH|nr:DUF4169 family protein [Methylobrevis albus]MBH0236705.1 DUF4169 family protein [Methylobrevis albus]
MGDVVNLRMARKQKQRAAKEATAAENRVRFGRTKAERERETALAELEAVRLEGHRRPDEP